MQHFFVYFFNGVFLVLLILSGHFLTRKSLSPLVFFGALVFKLTCGVFLGLLYQYHYEGGDTFNFYEEARAYVGMSHFWSAILEPTISSQPVRAIWFSRFTAVIIYFTRADYWICSLYFSTFSFLGSCYGVCRLLQYKTALKWPIVISFFFLPSVVFWSSGLLKESISYASMMVIIGFYAQIRVKIKMNPLEWISLALSVLVLVTMKYYVAALLFPSIIFIGLYEWNEKRKLVKGHALQKAFLIALCLVLPSYLFLIILSPNFYLENFLGVIQENHNSILLQTKPINQLSTIDTSTALLDWFLNPVYFLFSGLFRPLIGENMSFPASMSSIENALLFLLFSAAFFLRGIKVKRFKVETVTLTIYLMFTIMFLSYSVPNLGTIARYKVYYMPFVLLLIFSVYHARFLKNEGE